MIKKDQQKLSIVLPEEIVSKLDALAESELCTRSEQATKVIVNYFKEASQEKSIDKSTEKSIPEKYGLFHSWIKFFFDSKGSK